MNTVLVTIAGYDLSFLETLGTAAGFLCVWLTAREKILCWPVGIVNIIAFFIMFYQVRLYADMLLQVYFLVMSVYGWWKWTHPAGEAETDQKGELAISRCGRMELNIIIVMLFSGTLVMGSLMGSLHTLAPVLFPEKAAFPYLDSLIAIGSITAQYLMARKRLECWFLWLAVDVLAVYVYASKGILLVAAEYGVFAGMALYALMRWIREMRNEEPILENGMANE